MRPKILALLVTEWQTGRVPPRLARMRPESTFSRGRRQPRSITSLYPTRIEAVGRHLDWSPDGKYLVAADKRSADEPFQHTLIESATGHKIQVTTPPLGMIGDMGPAFSPDGKSIAFIRAISSGVDDIFIQPVAGGDDAADHDRPPLHHQL